MSPKKDKRAWWLPEARDEITSRVWLVGYDLELARQRYADRRQLLRQAAACVGLAILRKVGARHA